MRPYGARDAVRFRGPPSLFAAPELIDACCRLGRVEQARALADEFIAAAQAKGQAWSIARALRGQGLAASADRFAARFERALEQHAGTPDAFETARDTVAKAVGSETPPKYSRTPAGSKLDPFKEWICEQLLPRAQV